ncbi:MAG: hypothetical protein VCC01_13305 [Candidatus Hydrogenedentota bacterium]
MTTSRNVTIWDLLTMSLWSAFFAVGLVPEYVFHGLRALAHVSSYAAFVNSSAIITFALSAYVAFFVARQCRANGMRSADIQAKAIHVALLSILAFLEIPGRSPIFGTQTLLGLMLQSSLQVDQTLKVILWTVGCTKLAAWLYLYTLMLRFHVFGVRDVFTRMPTFFLRLPHEPQARRENPKDSKTSPPADEESL